MLHWDNISSAICKFRILLNQVEETSQVMLFTLQVLAYILSLAFPLFCNLVAKAYINKSSLLLHLHVYRLAVQEIIKLLHKSLSLWGSCEYSSPYAVKNACVMLLLVSDKIIFPPSRQNVHLFQL